VANDGPVDRTEAHPDTIAHELRVDGAGTTTPASTEGHDPLDERWGDGAW